MTRPNSNRTALIGVGVLTAIWSLNWTVGKIAMDYSGPFTFSALRYVTGTIGLFALLIVMRKPLKPTPWLPTILIGLTQTCAFQTLTQWSLVSGGAGKMVLFAYSMPFWVVPLAWWWLHERPGLARWLCIVAAAAGFVCVVEPWQPLGAPHSILMALGAGVVWAVSAVLAKRTFQKYPDVTPLRLTAWQMLIGTIGLVVIGVLTPERAVSWNATYIVALLYSGLLASSVAWAAWAVVVQQVPTSVAGLTSLAVPVGGVLLAWALLGEKPSGFEWIGIALIATAILALNMAGHMGRHAPPPTTHPTRP